MKQEEIAPGIYFKEDRGQFRLTVEDGLKELIAWDFDEIKEKPEAWLSSLKAVCLATQKGPSVAKNWIERKKSQNKVLPNTLICNVCQNKFVVEVNRPYAFIANLNGHNYHDYQCSEECNKKRYQEIYNKEMGSDFMRLWTQVKSSPLEKTRY